MLSAERQKVLDEAFRARWKEVGGTVQLYAAAEQVAMRGVYAKRHAVISRNPEWADDFQLLGQQKTVAWPIDREIQREYRNGSVLIGSDLHAWPGPPPIMWQAFVSVAHSINPLAIILNGDMLDGARVSRHGRTPFVGTPKISEEIDTIREWFSWLPNGPDRLWMVGNHDERVDKYLAQNASELEDYAGRLPERFPEWAWAWACVINGHTEVRHRFRGGIHAGRNNAVNSGWSMVTGDTHQLGISPVPTRRGTVYGVETGMLADPDHVAFHYNEGQPTRHRQGFAVLTFDADGHMLPPELCEWHNGTAIFRGRVVADARGPRVRVPAGMAT